MVSIKKKKHKKSKKAKGNPTQTEAEQPQDTETTTTSSTRSTLKLPVPTSTFTISEEDPTQPPVVITKRHWNFRLDFQVGQRLAQIKRKKPNPWDRLGLYMRIRRQRLPIEREMKEWIKKQHAINVYRKEQIKLKKKERAEYNKKLMAERKARSMERKKRQKEEVDNVMALFEKETQMKQKALVKGEVWPLPKSKQKRRRRKKGQTDEHEQQTPKDNQDQSTEEENSDSPREKTIRWNLPQRQVAKRRRMTFTTNPVTKSGSISEGVQPHPSAFIKQKAKAYYYVTKSLQMCQAQLEDIEREGKLELINPEKRRLLKKKYKMQHDVQTNEPTPRKKESHPVKCAGPPEETNPYEHPAWSGIMQNPELKFFCLVTFVYDLYKLDRMETTCKTQETKFFDNPDKLIYLQEMRQQIETVRKHRETVRIGLGKFRHHEPYKTELRKNSLDKQKVIDNLLMGLRDYDSKLNIELDRLRLESMKLGLCQLAVTEHVFEVPVDKHFEWMQKNRSVPFYRDEIKAQIQCLDEMEQERLLTTPPPKVTLDDPWTDDEDEPNESETLEEETTSLRSKTLYWRLMHKVNQGPRQKKVMFASEMVDGLWQQESICNVSMC